MAAINIQNYRYRNRGSAFKFVGKSKANLRKIKGKINAKQRENINPPLIRYIRFLNLIGREMTIKTSADLWISPRA